MHAYHPDSTADHFLKTWAPRRIGGGACQQNV